MKKKKLINVYKHILENWKCRKNPGKPAIYFAGERIRHEHNCAIRWKSTLHSRWCRHTKREWK